MLALARAGAYLIGGLLPDLGGLGGEDGLLPLVGSVGGKADELYRVPLGLAKSPSIADAAS